MSAERRITEPTELVYLPAPSWLPALLAAGLAGVIVSMFTWWPYGVVGAVVALVAAGLWIRDARRDFARLPRRQRTSSAPIPPTLLERRPARR
ncbi:MAG TPA: hypothetical protein VK919_03255 [Solirubrobacterales bacterium]|nr:hypothetical protein [Solirubrobacterales bacterium]